MNLPDLTSLFPITAISAIIIFVIKEALELIKRKRADNRKRTAIRTILANECERNNWSINTMRYIMKKLEDYKLLEFDQSANNYEIKIFKDASGEKHFRFSIGQTSYSSILIPDAQKSALEKHLMDIALVDKKAFSKAIKAYESIVNLDYIISRTISIVSEGDDIFRHLRSIVPHNKRSLDECYSDINALYRECVGRELTDERSFGRTVPKPTLVPTSQSSDKSPAADR